MVLPILLALISAQAPDVPAPAPAARPAWIETLPEQPGRWYALGSAELAGAEGPAVSRASDRARLEVVARLRTSIQGQTRIATSSSELGRDGVRVAAVGERQVRDEVRVSAQAQDLPGLIVERTFVDGPGRSVYALAYLDLAQARETLAGRLARVQEGRARLPEERSRKARWHLRKLKDDLDRLEDSLGLLASAGVGQDLRGAAQIERTALEGRLAALAQGELPPLDLARIAVALRSNIDLPLGIQAYLEAQIKACGLTHRDLGPDLVLDLTFIGGDKGPEFIFVDMDVYRGVTYRVEAQLRLLEAGGAALGRTVAIQVAQGSSPEGMVEAFRRQFERRLAKLVADFQNELQ